MSFAGLTAPRTFPLPIRWGETQGEGRLNPSRSPTRSFLSRAILPVTIGLLTALSAAAAPDPSFVAGSEAFHAGDYHKAAASFQASAARRPAAGTFQNLGLAWWHQGRIGDSIQAWERAIWLDPFNQPSRVNLRFARKAAQLETPELSWNEVVSSWLPLNWWAWIAGLSLWLTVGMATLPGVFRRPRTAWHQALTSFGLMLFLLSLPAHLGVHTRSQVGFVLPKDIPLRLTPTDDGQALTHLASGEPVRRLRARGNFFLVRTTHATGWVARSEIGFVCPP